MLQVTHNSWGSDPEAFFSKEGAIIGSEKLIPKSGIRSTGGKIVRDGVQFELNPNPSTINGLGNNIAHLYGQLLDILGKNPGVTVDFKGLVEVSRSELDSLSPKSRILGCMPSHNIYGERPITVDPKTYRKRSSGGHIHVSLAGNAYTERRSGVPLFDIFVGNTSVLFDRDLGAAERRENYGRAGEFRLPNYGLEYRTVSNFWLRNYTLMSLVYGMSQIAVSLLTQTAYGQNDAYEGLTKVVNIDNIQKAINTNNYGLALRNFKRIVPWLQKNLPDSGFQLAPDTIKSFLVFAERVKDVGVDKVFPTKTSNDILLGWRNNKRTDLSAFIQKV